MKNKKSVISLHFFIALMLMFWGCHSTSKASSKHELLPEEKIWMHRFFEHLLLDNCGIYTLWGSKPMVRFEMCLYSSEELSKLQDEVEENENAETVTIENYNFPENWEKWEKIRDQFNIRRFLIFKRDSPDDPKLPWIFFVNIYETALVIQKNYPIFRKRIGEDFDSLDVVFELQEESSKFWDIVFEQSELVGLLYGFGLENSLCFSWKYRDNKANIQDFAHSLNSNFSIQRKNYGSATIHTFSLPIFAEFNKNHCMVNRYEAERKEIKKIYKNQDFVTYTLNKLTE